MSFYQIFAQVSNGEVKDIAVFANYTTANKITKMEYGNDAQAIECSNYKVCIGCKYINNTFYENDGVKECERNITVNTCHEEMVQIQEQYKSDIAYIAIMEDIEL